jgi:C4-dicarboxylate-specific signal transduction histidine kinase
VDLERFPGTDHEQRLRDGLRAKYAGLTLDGIVAFGPSPLRFLIRWGHELWPGVPAVAAAVDELLLGSLVLPDNVTPIPMRYDVEGTVRLALRLLPDTRRVALIAGGSPMDRHFADLYRQRLVVFGDGLELIDLSGLALGEVLRRIAALPDGTILLLSGFTVDGAGRSFLGVGILPTISAAANRPAFSVFGPTLGAGVVGGSMVDFRELGAEAARVLVRILSGEVVAESGAGEAGNRLLVDWRQLRRWRLDESRLPSGTQVLYREPTLWEQYRWGIVSALGLLVSQTLVVVALLFERRRRRRAQAALEGSEALNRAVLAALPSQLAVIDGDGVIIHVNEEWTAFARQNGGEGDPRLSVGANYLEVCRRAVRASDPTAGRALAMIESVLNGGNEGQPLEYFGGRPGEDRWFEMQVRRLDHAGGNAVIVHRDITERKLAEAEARRTLGTMAHLERVAAVGELASALAHELNQPLTAILANAQAAQQWLATPSPDLAEVRETVDDIVAEDVRAGEVIWRMRGLLRKGELRADAVDLNEIAREVTRLVANDALLRGASIELDLTPALPKVRGDAVQLQQVLLNLLVNALHAVADEAPDRRRLVVRTKTVDGSVEATVEDSGKGIAESDLRHVFEPFFTTKGEGLGVGLSISRSIVEAHGGRISAENRADGGASFRVRLPAGSPAAGPIGRASDLPG